MKFTDWKNSWLVGGILLLAFLFMDQHPLIQNMERALYDWGVRVASYTPLQDRIVIVAVDDESISRLGRWPWSRNLHAKAIDLLSKGRPKQIVNTLFYLEPQTDPGQTHLINLKNFLDTSRLKKSLEEQKAMLTFPSLVMDMQTMTTMLDNALADLDADKHLATSIRHAGNVLLGMPFTLGRPLGRPSEDLPPYLLKNFIAHTKGSDNQTLLAKSASPPLEILGTEASGIGHLLTPLDSDGGVRTLPLAIDYYGAYFPSLALLSAAHSLGIDSRGVILRPGAGIQLGRLWIQTDPRLRMFPFYYSDGIQPAFQVDSIHDVLSGRILPQKYRDKIVLLGVTATGVTTRHPTPLSPTTTPVEILAHTISSILDEVYFTVPEWYKPARLSVYLLCALYIIVLLPRMSAGMAALTTLIILVSLTAMHLHLMMQSFLWISMAGPMLMLVVGFFIIATLRMITAQEQHLQAAAETAESNRLLGISLQTQGMLDMAYEKFLKCADLPNMVEIFYNLGLDFERRRQFGKAASVYQLVASKKADFMDVQERIRHVTSLRDTTGIVLDNAGTLVAPAMPSGANTLPTLGRYQVERELGRGAMGVVYLGMDPKMNRALAIKAISLLNCSEEGEDSEATKRRFFQEAESAGRLNHPNIVTLYDVGEDNDLAFIAMEYVDGTSLEPFTRPNSRLPLPMVIEIIAKVAVALDYAHRNGVIHRDVKPGNVLYNPEKKLIKLSDFGIARITVGERAKTKTGVVMGTPQYMSPEQVSGRAVDGRSDIFSLGVMAYQLLTGHLPFTSKEITTLIFQITQEPPPPMDDVELVVKECIEGVILKALAKSPDKRYRRGMEMAKALLECAKKQRDAEQQG